MNTSLSGEKVVWFDGMYLRPQHFQQQDRYFESLIEYRCGHLRPYNWVIIRLRLDDSQLQAENKIAVQMCQGIFPDGTPFNITQGGDLPPEPLRIEESQRDILVFLALPLRDGFNEVELKDHQNASPVLARYRVEAETVADNTVGRRREESIKVGKRRFLLIAISEEELQQRGYAAVPGCTSIQIAHIIDFQQGHMRLDDSFIPPCLDCFDQPMFKDSQLLLHDYLHQLQGWLTGMCEKLASRISETPERERLGEIENLLTLQIVNAYKLLIDHMIVIRRQNQLLHPEDFYRVCLQLVGQLSASSGRYGRKPPSLPVYDHQHLHRTFPDLMEELRAFLQVRERPVIELEIIDEARHRGIYMVVLDDNIRSQLLSARFVILAARININQQEEFPNRCKISSLEGIEHLIETLTDDIVLKKFPQIPQGIPFDQSFGYYEIPREHVRWENVVHSKALAFYIPGEFPQLDLRLWVVMQ